MTATVEETPVAESPVTFYIIQLPLERSITLSPPEIRGEYVVGTVNGYQHFGAPVEVRSYNPQPGLEDRRIMKEVISEKAKSYSPSLTPTEEQIKYANLCNVDNIVGPEIEEGYQKTYGRGYNEVMERYHKNLMEHMGVEEAFIKAAGPSPWTTPKIEETPKETALAVYDGDFAELQEQGFAWKLLEYVLRKKQKKP
jgi:hypothetical protein